MHKKYWSKLQGLAANKHVAIAVAGLALITAFIIFSDRQQPAKAVNLAQQRDEFVIKEQENDIQPTNLPPDNIYPADAVISEKVPEKQADCAADPGRDLLINASSSPMTKRLRVPILMYHYIESPVSTTLPWLYHPPAVFDAQLKTLASHCYRTIFVSDVADAIKAHAKLPHKSIALTFDDGYEDMYTQAFPLLKKYEMKGTMYIIVNALDKPGYLTKSQVREMSDSGYVEIAAHTMNHINLRQASYQTANYEIAGSKFELSKIIGKPVTDLAYPYGFFTARDEQICEKAGYLSCASTYPGQVQTLDKRFSLYRLRPAFKVGAALINWLEMPGPKK